MVKQHLLAILKPLVFTDGFETPVFTGGSGTPGIY